MSTHLVWDLDSIFPGGSESQELVTYLEQLTADLTAAEKAGLSETLNDDTQSTWVTVIKNIYDIGSRLNQAGSFVTCLVSQNVKDEKALQLQGQIEQLRAQLGTIWTRYQATFTRQEDPIWNKLTGETDLAPIAFHLNEERNLARQKMAPELETLANQLATNGYHAWDRLYGLVSGDKQVEFEGETFSLGQLQSKYMDAPERATRQAAFTLFEENWQELAKVCAMALNFQAGFRLTLYQQRGWNSVLHEPLLNNRISHETLATMWRVIDAKSSKLLDYFEAKANLFGLDQLSWYDVYAPVGTMNRTISYEEAVDFVVENTRKFHPKVADFCRMAVEKRWIEAENRPGKRAGGYCTGLPVSQESRIFMTYTGSFNSLLTLAHELGHAYHGWVMRDLPYGARRYTMSVAETASTFCESLVNNAALAATENETERLSILGTKLNDTATFLMNIRARYDFERAFFAERAKKQLSVDDLNRLMQSAQKTAYKQGLAQYHPLFWASKLHFYITRAPFYNFPYTFGFLFSTGVYAQAEAEGPAFHERYVALLRDTGSMDTETLAKKHLGVDLTRPDFWETAVDLVLADVDEFVALTNR